MIVRYVSLVAGAVSAGGMLRSDGKFQIKDSSTQQCLTLQMDQLHAAWDADAGAQAFFPLAMFQECNQANDKQWFEHNDVGQLKADGKCLSALAHAGWSHTSYSGCDKWAGYEGAGAYLFGVGCTDGNATQDKFVYSFKNDDGFGMFKSACEHGLFIGMSGSADDRRGFLTASSDSFETAVVVTGVRGSTSTVGEQDEPSGYGCYCHFNTGFADVVEHAEPMDGLDTLCSTLRETALGLVTTECSDLTEFIGSSFESDIPIGADLTDIEIETSCNMQNAETCAAAKCRVMAMLSVQSATLGEFNEANDETNGFNAVDTCTARVTTTTEATTVTTATTPEPNVCSTTYSDSIVQSDKTIRLLGEDPMCAFKKYTAYRAADEIWLTTCQNKHKNKNKNGKYKWYWDPTNEQIRSFGAKKEGKGDWCWTMNSLTRPGKQRIKIYRCSSVNDKQKFAMINGRIHSKVNETICVGVDNARIGDDDGVPITMQLCFPTTWGDGGCNDELISGSKGIRPFDWTDNTCIYKKYNGYEEGHEVWFGNCKNIKSKNKNKNSRYKWIWDANTGLIESLGAARDTDFRYCLSLVNANRIYKQRIKIQFCDENDDLQKFTFTKGIIYSVANPTLCLGYDYAWYARDGDVPITAGFCYPNSFVGLSEA